MVSLSQASKSYLNRLEIMHNIKILTSQTSTRSQIIGFGTSEFDAQRTFPNTFENIVVRRVDIPEDNRRFQKVLQYARSKVDYSISEKNVHASNCK